jgi:hypothetical protein
VLDRAGDVPNASLPPMESSLTWIAESPPIAGALRSASFASSGPTVRWLISVPSSDSAIRRACSTASGEGAVRRGVGHVLHAGDDLHGDLLGPPVG